MKTRILAALTAAALYVSALMFPAGAEEVRYTDVSSSAWYFEAVETVSAKGWMQGTGEHRFSPDAALTRAMLAVVLWRMEGCPAAGAPASFTDAPADAWYAGGLSFGVEKGFFAGYPDGRFGPDDAVTREQLAMAFYRYTGGMPVGDAEQVSVTNGCAWAADACAWANANGYFSDAMGQLDLCAPACRAEIAYWLSQYKASDGAADDVNATVPSSLTEGSFGTMGYLLYTPADAKPDMPLILYLHGGHGKGSDLSVLTDTDGFPQYLADGRLGEVAAYVLIPQLPTEWRGWKPAADVVMQLLDRICTENGIDRSRISLTGHSMGGTGTWDLALTYPDVFSRIAPMSGSVDTTASTLAALQNTPVWAFVGEDDVVVKPESSEQFVAALGRQNEDARITVFPETDHVGVPQKAWLERGGELLNWLLG